MLTGDTPAIRLDQSDSSGFAPATWDVAGNEVNFFVRNDGKLPFRIRPGAPTSALDISSTGLVGMGTEAPDANLHIASTGDTALRLTSTGAADWKLVTRIASGHLAVTDELSGTRPLIIKKGAPTGVLSLETDPGGLTGRLVIGNPNKDVTVAHYGALRLVGLPNCATGLRTDAVGRVSCAPATPAPRATVGSPLASAGAATPGSRSVGGGRGSQQRPGKPGGTAAAGDEAGESQAASCGALDIAGDWSLLASSTDAYGTVSALWCDAMLSSEPQAPGKLAIKGTCRNHGAADTPAETFELTGESTVTDPARCTIGGQLQMRSESGALSTATVLEGRIEASTSARRRGVMVTRWSRSEGTVVQTISLSR
jgi:hypothetical protein